MCEVQRRSFFSSCYENVIRKRLNARVMMISYKNRRIANRRNFQILSAVGIVPEVYSRCILTRINYYKIIFDVYTFLLLMVKKLSESTAPVRQTLKSLEIQYPHDNKKKKIFDGYNVQFISRYITDRLVYTYSRLTFDLPNNYINIIIIIPRYHEIQQNIINNYDLKYFLI